jgi:hypothetical protein
MPAQYSDKKVLEEKYPDPPALSAAEDPEMVSPNPNYEGKAPFLRARQLTTEHRTEVTSTRPVSSDNSETPTPTGGTPRSDETSASRFTRTTTC